MPQGGIDEGEDPAAAALRELIEETGMRSVEILGETAGLAELRPAAELVGKAWGGRYRGQKQKWFAVRFLGEESEIDIVPADRPQGGVRRLAMGAARRARRPHRAVQARRVREVVEAFARYAHP